MSWKRKVQPFLKKSAAVLTASGLVLTGTLPVMAAGSYQEAEKECLGSMVKDIEETWDESMESYEKTKQGMHSNFGLQLDEAGRSLLGIAAPIDISWLDRVDLSMDATVNQAGEAFNMQLLLNNTPLCMMKVFIDFAGMTEYLQIPEFSESWLKAALIMTEDGGAEISEESMKAIWNMASDMTAIMPDAATAGTLLDRYGTLLIEHMEEGPSIEETVSVEGIGEDCTVYEGQIHADALQALAEEIMTTAKEDKELEALLQTWSEAFPDSGDLNAQMQEGIESALGELKAEQETETEEETGNGEYFSSKIWVNGEGKIIGRELSLCEGVDVHPLVTWKNPHKDDTSAVLLEINADNGVLTFTGSGEENDGIMTGNYVFAVDGVAGLNVEMEKYDTQAAKDGKMDGTFRLTLAGPAGGEEGQSEAGLYQNMSLVLNVLSDSKTGTGEITLGLESAGASLGTLKITDEPGEGVEIPDVEKMDKLYDMQAEADMTSYLKEINWDSVLENAGKAGVPEELVAQLDSILQAAFSEENLSAAEAYEESLPMDSAEE